jgi:hypothetical protein
VNNHVAGLWSGCQRAALRQESLPPPPRNKRATLHTRRAPGAPILDERSTFATVALLSGYVTTESVDDREGASVWNGREERKKKRSGAPGGNRTPGLQVRSLSLYPSELRARNQPSLAW